MGTVTRDLNEAQARFDAANDPVITYRGLEWPEFEHFLSACNQLEKTASRFISSLALESVLKNLRYARRRLRTLPIAPAFEGLGLNSFASEDSVSFNPELDHALQQCRAATESLLRCAQHPAATFLQERISRVRRHEPQGLIYAIVSRDCVSDMQAASDDLNLDLLITDLSGAKRVDTGALCFIMGTPESLLGMGVHWMELAAAERKVAWLFNAPIAQEVCIVSWPGNRRFEVDRYSIFPGASLKISSSTGRETFPIESTFEFVSRSDEVAPNFSDHEASASELVDAQAIQLAGGLWVYYSTGPEGPRPDRIIESDFMLSVEDVNNASQLNPGDRLVVRSGDASRSFLRREAQTWLELRHGPTEYEACEVVRNRFREGMRSLESSATGEAVLRNLGLSDTSINYRFRLAHDEAHIAPEAFDEFRKLCEAFGWTPTSTDWDHIRHLRSAMKRAGRIARQKMEDHISTDDSWMEIVDKPDAARIEMGELGGLVISRILNIRPDVIKVPISRIGQIQVSTGSAS